MLTLTIASGKGGTLKTTLTALLAVTASHDLKRVAIIDLNADQASLTRWWKLRGEPATPFLMGEEQRTKLHQDVRILKAAGFKALLIDTPPDDMQLIEGAITVSNGVVIPVRASSLDIEAARAVVDIAKRRRKPYAFLLVAVDGRQAFHAARAAAMAELRKLGGHILAPDLPHHAAYVDAMAEGKTGAELDPKRAKEIASIWMTIRLMEGLPRD